MKKQGYTLMSLLVVMILSRFGGLSIYASQKTGYIDVDDNTIYRLMNSPFVDWKSILLSFAKQFIRYVSDKGEAEASAVKCFVLDNTEIEKNGKTIDALRIGLQIR